MNNSIELFRDLSAFHAQNSTVQVNVFAACQFRMKSSTNLEQTPHPSVELNFPVARMCNSRQNLEERRLATTVASYNSQHIARHHFKAHIAQRPYVGLDLAC